MRRVFLSMRKRSRVSKRQRVHCGRCFLDAVAFSRGENFENVAGAVFYWFCGGGFWRAARHGIISAFSPRMTTADSAKRQSHSSQQSKPQNRLDCVSRTRRRKAASHRRPEQQALARRDGRSVKTNGQDENFPNQNHGFFLAVFSKTPALRSMRISSLSTSLCRQS